MVKDKSSINMTLGKPSKVIVSFAIPLILSNLFQQLYTIVDNILVGKVLGTDALAAVGSAGSVIAVVVQLATGLSLGGSIVISQYFGANRYKEIKESISTITIFSGILGLILTFLLLRYPDFFLRLIHTPNAIRPLGTTYLFYYSLGTIPVFVYNSLNAGYIALGNSKTPLKFLILSSILNILLDLLFMVVWHFGLIGAALATVLSQSLTMILALIDLPKHLSAFSTKDEDIQRFNYKLLKLLLSYGLPSALQQSIVSVGSLIVQATINTYGSVVIAACTASSKIINLATTIPQNFSNAYANYVGQNIGANKTSRISPGLKASLVICCSILAIITILLTLFSKSFILLFIKNDDPKIVREIVSIGASYVRTVGFFLIIFAIFMLMKATFKGSGDMKFFIFSTLLSFFIRLLLTVYFTHRTGIYMIWWSICIGWTISMFVTILHYYKGNWKNKSIVK